MKVYALALCACWLLCGCHTSTPVSTTPGTTPQAIQPQPSAADRQRDIAITQELRRKLMDDQSVSVNGRNIMITTSGGVVTLRGAVDDEMERSKIIAKANQTTGIKGIRDQLETLNRSVAAGRAISR